MDELLKIKHELTKEKDEKLSEIARVRVFYFIFSNSLPLFYILCEFSRANVPQKFQQKTFFNFAKTSTLSCFKNSIKQYSVGLANLCKVSARPCCHFL